MGRQPVVYTASFHHLQHIFLDLKLHSRAQMHGLLSPALRERVCVLLAISKGYNSIRLSPSGLKWLNTTENMDPNLFSLSPRHKGVYPGHLAQNQQETILFAGGFLLL